VTVDGATSFVRDRGVILASAMDIGPRLANAIAGEPIGTGEIQGTPKSTPVDPDRIFRPLGS